MKYSEVLGYVETCSRDPELYHMLYWSHLLVYTDERNEVSEEKELQIKSSLYNKIINIKRKVIRKFYHQNMEDDYKYIKNSEKVLFNHLLEGAYGDFSLKRQNQCRIMINLLQRVGSAPQLESRVEKHSIIVDSLVHIYNRICYCNR